VLLRNRRIIIFNFTILFLILGFIFIPLIGLYIGVRLVISDDNNKWQDDNSDAYLIHNGK
jgi:hypothetical protein